MEWFEVKCEDKQTLEDFTRDVRANTADEAKQIVENEWKAIFNVCPYRVWAVWGK